MVTRKQSADAVANTVVALPSGALIPLITTTPDNKYITVENAAADTLFSSAYQALDATLTSLSALGTAADRFAYTTGVDTWAEGTITAFARTILDDADAAAARTTLGLAIGTDVQAYSANLTTYAGIAPSANVQSLLGAANYAAFNELAGLGVTDSPTFAGVTTTGNGRFNRAAIGDDITPNPLIGNNIRIFVTDPASYGGAAGSDISLYDTSTGDNDHGNSGLWVQGIYQSEYNNVGGWNRGLFVRSALTRGGDLTTLWGIEVQYGPDEAQGTGTIDVAMGIDINPKNIAGTITTGYGIRIREVQGATRYAIYQEGSTLGSVFEGTITALRLTATSKITGADANGYLDICGDPTSTDRVRFFDDGDVDLDAGKILSFGGTSNVYMQEASGGLFVGTDGGFVYYLDTARNFLLGTGTTPTNAARNLVLSVDATAATAITDAVSIYAKDRSAGNTMLGFRQEGTAFITGTPAAATGAWAVEVNGTTVYLEGSTTAPS